jgi:hypothetical protein
VSDDQRNYDIHLDDKYGSLTLIDLPAEIAAHDPWFNQTVTTVNDAVVRLGVIEGDFHGTSTTTRTSSSWSWKAGCSSISRIATPSRSTRTRATPCRGASCTAPARQSALRSSWSNRRGSCPSATEVTGRHGRDFPRRAHHLGGH